MKTRKGIYLNLLESDYNITLNNLTFYFSSKIYLQKFANNVKSYIDTEQAKINIKYGIYISLSSYLMLAYYKKIEKRGFRVYNEKTKREISENVALIDEIIMY